jgi:sugar phosphate isomerase/epimerase
MQPWPIGVFTSLDAGLGVQLEVAKELGVSTIQLHAPSKQKRTPGDAKELLQRLDRLGMELTAVFAGFEGESYADIPTVGRTVGLAPKETRAARTAEMVNIANYTRELGCSVVGLHLGVVPHDPADPLYSAVLEVTRKLCDHCQANHQSLHLETGQEPAVVLLEFLQRVDRDNLFINFDPANMILYGAGKPLEALEILGRYVRSVHCKDAKWAARPRKEWGQEMPLGQGDVDIAGYLRTLKSIGYLGPLTIERELSQDPVRQRDEILLAVNVLEKLKREILD